METGYLIALRMQEYLAELHRLERIADEQYWWAGLVHVESPDLALLLWKESQYLYDEARIIRADLVARQRRG